MINKLKPEQFSLAVNPQVKQAINVLTDKINELVNKCNLLEIENENLKKNNEKK